VRALDNRLKDHADYLGFTQVLPRVESHQYIFGHCSPRYQVEAGEIFVLYSEFSDDEWLADEIIEWWKEESQSSDAIYLTTILSKRNVGYRYTSFDDQADPKKELAIQVAIQQLADEWEVQSERTLYALQDRVPDALEEFLAATEVLSKPELSPSDSAQIAVNLRRTLEHLTRFACPDDGKEGPGWVRRRWGKYSEHNAEKLGKYGDLLVCEAVGAHRAISKLEAMYQMGNKGVHENWDPQIFRGIVLRLLLLMDAVVSLKLDQRVVRLDRTVFNQHLSDD
jgi:predicted nucleic acid-binding protein